MSHKSLSLNPWKAVSDPDQNCRKGTAARKATFCGFLLELEGGGGVIQKKYTYNMFITEKEYIKETLRDKS